MTPSTLRGLALLAVASLTLACPSPRAKRTTRQPPAEPTTAWEQPSSEAERTRRMEDQARDINQRWSETQQMEGSDADKERAVQELLEKQQQLNREGQGEPAPPPPPE